MRYCQFLRFLGFILISMGSTPIYCQANELLARIPANLSSIESGAEDTFDNALAGDLQKVLDNSIIIENNWLSYRPETLRAGAAEQDVIYMDQRVSELKRAATITASKMALARFANAISGLIDRFYALYSPVVPPVVNRLDFLGRELVLDGMESSFDAAYNVLANLKGAWVQLKLIVIKKGGTSEAEAFSHSLTAIENAIETHDASLLVKSANTILEDIDAIEKIF